MPPNSSPSLATVERPVIAARGGVVARGGVAGLITVAATVVALVPAMVVSPPPAAAQQQVTQTTSARCNGRAESNFAWQQDNSDRLCTLLAGGTCSAGTQGCTVAVNANMSATAADPHLLTAIHAWVGVVFGGQMVAQFLCDGASTRSVARCAAGGSTTVPAGANFDVIVGGSVLTSGVGTPRWATVDAAATISSSWTPCSADVPCWVAVFINGAVRAPDQSRVDTRWGIGIVTMEPAPVHGEGWVGPFKRESWAARFNDSAVCWDGDQDVGSCQGAGVFAQPATVTLTAHAVPAGGFSVNAAPNDQDPNWSSRFVRWGGDCARAGSDDSCTLRVGTQHSTVQGAEGSFSLSVTAVFEISDPGSGDSGF